MKPHRTSSSWLALVTWFAVALILPVRLGAHCDGMDGPVVKSAQKALETGNVNLILIWIQKKDEAEVRKSFEKALAVRELGSDARELADLYFFETVVRIHRAGEGAPFTGLKPAGRDLGPAIPAGDRALETGSVEALLRLLVDEVRSGVSTRFTELNAQKNFRPDDVDAGRRYVKTYVEFIHYLERIHQASTSASHGHFDEAEAGGAQEGLTPNHLSRTD